MTEDPKHSGTPYISKNYTLTLPDKVAPELTITAPTVSETLGSDIEIIANASDVGGITSTDQVSITVNGVAVANEDITFGGEESSPQDRTIYAKARNLVTGSAEIIVSVTDDAGNTASKTVSVTIDADAPEITINSPIADSWTNDTVIFSAVINDAEISPGWYVTLNDTYVTNQVTNETVDGAVVLSGVFTAETGENTISISVYDLHGNQGTVSLSFNVDTTVPLITVDSLDGKTFKHDKVVINATVSDAESGVDADSIVVSLGEQILTSAEYTVTEENGVYSICATVSPEHNTEAVLNVSAKNNVGLESLASSGTFTRLNPPTIDKVVVTANPAVINITETAQLTAVVYDQYGDVITGEEVVYTVSPSEAGTISGNVFTAALTANGEVTITAAVGTVSNTTAVNVIPQTATSIVLTPETTTLSVNNEFQFTAVVKDQLGNVMVNQPELVWSSSNQSVATIENGKVNTVECGETDITVSVKDAEDVTASAKVTVLPLVPTTFELTETSYSVTSTQSVELSFTILDQNGEEMKGELVDWTVSDNTLGYFEGNIFYANATTEDKTVTVTAIPVNNNTLTATADIVIAKLYAKTIIISGEVPVLEVGDEFTVTAEVYDQLGNVLETPVTWTSSKTDVGTVDAGVITAVKAGETVITASAGTASNTTDVKVANLIPRSMTISVDKESINATQTAVFTATVYDKNSKEITDAPIIWTVAPTTAGTIENGVFTADKAASGTVTITAQAKDNTTVTASQEITVIALHAAEITLTAVPEISLEVNETFQFEAQVKDQLGNLFEETITWELDNDDVGTIESGLFTAVSVGTVNITANAGDAETTPFMVTVVPAVPYEIAISPATAVLNHTETVTLAVTIKDKRGDVIESEFTWAKDTDDCGTLENGIFTAGKLIEKNGVVTVTVTPAANESIHANATITVNGFFASGITITNKSTNTEIVNAVELKPGQKYSFNATVKDQFGNDFSEGYVNLNWTCSNNKVGTIGQKTGEFTAVAVGETTINATSGNVFKTILVKVYEEVNPSISVTTEVKDNGAVNMTLPTNENVDVKVNEEAKTTEIKDTENKVILTISFETMTNTSTHVEGNISSITAEYEKRAAAAAEGVGNVEFSLNLNLKNITELPVVKPVINETKKQQIHNMDDFKNHEVGAMVEVDSDINSDLKSAELVFYIPKEWAEKSKMKVLHIKDNSVNSHSADIVDNGDGNWKITITVTGFSAYAVTKDTYVAPETPSPGGNGNGGSTGGGSTHKPTTTPSEPVTPPTDEPSDDPSDVPGTDIPDIQPVEPTEPKSPAPVAGMILGALAAAAVLRRK